MSGTSGRSQSRQKSFTSRFRNGNAARGGSSFEERMNIWRCCNMVPLQRCASPVEFRNCCRVHTASPPMARLQNRRNCGCFSPAITNFDIQARFPPETPNSAFLQMLQRLLEERFRMVLHREPREFSVLALVPGKGKKEGLRLHSAAAPGGSYKFRAFGGHAT